MNHVPKKIHLEEFCVRYNNYKFLFPKNTIKLNVEIKLVT